MGDKRVTHPTGGEKLTQQHMEGVTDINKIMERQARTGVLSSGKPSGALPQFRYVSADSFHEMLIKVQELQGAFSALGAKVRKRFANNPENLFRFLEDRKNLREAVALGLVDESQVSPEEKRQMDLVEASDAEERRQFDEWRRKTREQRMEAPFRGDSDVDGQANSMPNRPDPEAQPSFSKKKRTP